VEAVLTEFTANTRVFEAAEGSVSVEDVIAVNIDSACAETVSEFESLVDIFGDDAGAKTVVGVVGALDHLISVFEFHDGHDGSENFLLSDGHVISYICEDGGLNVPALVTVTVSTSHQFSTLLLAKIDIVHNLIELLFINLRALINLIEGITKRALR